MTALKSNCRTPGVNSILAQNLKNFNRTSRPVVIGEVLFDRFPDGKKVLGGAPFNVAWNLQGFGENPIFVSAVGHDQAADEIRQKMIQHGMEDSGLQSNDRPTGNVQVSFDDGEPSYEIEPNQAWDFLSANDLPFEQGNLPDEAAVVYHGSLIWRNPASRAVLESLRTKADATVFVDLNIRLPWFELDQAEQILSGVDSLKLSVDELATLAGQKLCDDKTIGAAAEKVLAQYSLDSLWVTAGAGGAYYFDDRKQSEFAAASDIDKLVDTVGAGDAFTAAVIYGMLNSHEPKSILTDAVKFAAKVCGLQGATTDDKNFYRLS